MLKVVSVAGYHNEHCEMYFHLLYHNSLYWMPVAEADGRGVGGSREKTVGGGVCNFLHPESQNFKVEVTQKNFQSKKIEINI